MCFGEVLKVLRGAIEDLEAPFKCLHWRHVVGAMPRYFISTLNRTYKISQQSQVHIMKGEILT